MNNLHTVVNSVQTGKDGNYTLTGVLPGTYTVEQILQTGYTQTTSPAFFNVAVVAGQSLTGVSFGDFQLATVTGEVFNDVHDDGTLDSGDAGLTGWTVQLLDSGNKVVATTTTNSAGDYSLSDIGPGTYSIAAVAQSGYTQTAPGSGPITISPTSGASVDDENFGEYKSVELAVSHLSTTPSSTLQSGMTVVVQWTDTNTGTRPASGSFSDQIVIKNTTTGDVLATANVLYNATSSGNLAAGATVTQQYSFTLPNGGAGVGQIEFTVTADFNQNVSTPAGEPNDTVTLTETSTLAPYAELVPSSITAPASVDPGAQTSVAWTLTNSGSAAATGPWTEQVFLATDASGDNRTLLAAQSFSGSLAAGQSVARSIDLQIPNLSPGNYWIVVTEDAFDEVFELNTAASTLVASEPTSLAGGLTLTLASGTESDAAGAAATTATVTRNTSTLNALTVTIANSDPHDVTAPATVTIPAGATSVTFAVGTIDNDVVEGTQTATLTASATSLASGSAILTVTDTNVPTLAVALNRDSVNETDTNPATYGTVTRNTSTTGPLTVSLLSSDNNKLTVPATVTIPAGTTSATFPVTVINDEKIDGDETVTITASSSGFQSNSDSAVVIDDNAPTLTLTLAQTTVSEAAGADATTGTVSIPSPASQPITIALGSTLTTAASVPAMVVIDAGQESATFPITAINDGQDEGNQTAIITASVETDAGVIVNQGSTFASLLLLNANGPALTVSFASSSVYEGTTATATVTRNTSTTGALVVNLASTDPTAASVPQTVTIPAGQASVSFSVYAVPGGVPEGMQQVQISAAAAGLDTGIATLGITNVALSDLVVSSVNAPASSFDNSALAISWTVTNSGDYPATGSWDDELYLDPVGGPASTTPVAAVTFTGTVNPGQSYTQTTTITSPADVGEYTVRVVTDSSQSVQELSFANNTGVAAEPLNDQAAYTATVTPSASVVSAGTPVVLSGLATLTSDGNPAADEPVAVQVLVAGTTRTLTATTDSNGHFSVTFQPLATEAGEYSVTAADPGVSNPAVQAYFQIVGMTATPSTTKLTVVPNTPLTGTFALSNLSSTALSGLTASASSDLSNLTVQLTPPSQIAGDGTAKLAYSLDYTGTQAASGVVSIHVTTTQGAELTILLGVTAVPLTPILAVNPGYLDVGMVIGDQTLVSFTVVNNGGAPSGDLQVGIPDSSFMSLASPATILSLAPGASSTVTVELTPPANLPLEEYTGAIAIGGSQSGIRIPFNFNAVTTATGNVSVLVDDDYTFEEAGSPHVDGATVNLLNPYDNTDVIATGTTDATGSITFASVPAGTYDLQVEASGHSTYEAAYTVIPGITNNDEVFISRQFVTYTWNVQQTTIQDTYQIQLQTTFLTNVPAPVVTISAPASIPILQPGQSGTFNITLTNHGLIAAQSATLNLPTDPQYTFTALTNDVGVIPADSSVVVPVTVTNNAVNISADGIIRDAAEPKPCTDALSLLYYYACYLYYIPEDVDTEMNIPGRACDAEDLLDALPSFGGGVDDFGEGGGPGYIVEEGPPGPDDDSSVICNPNLVPLKNQANKTNSVAHDPPMNTAPAISGTELAANSITSNGGVSPLSFFATALGNLGLINGQSGNSGDTPADADQMVATIATFNQVEADLAAIFTTAAAEGGSLGISGDIALLQGVDGRLEAVTNAENVLFGGDANWLDTNQSATLQQWMTDFFADAESSGGGGMITADQTTQLLATTLPSSVSTNEATEFIARWNRTVQYWGEGVFDAAQVPAGQSADFLDLSAIQTSFKAALDAELQSQVNGYSDPGAEIQGALTQFVNDLDEQGVCATITLQLDQSAALTRTAFVGTLSITNSEETSTNSGSNGSLTNVVLDINIADANGNPANGQFFITSPSYSGAFSVVDGVATLPDNGTGTISFTFIPDDSAATAGPTIYNIGGTIGFTDPSGGAVTVPVFPAAITVEPQAELDLNYFLQSQVVGADPFTPQDIIPSEPAVLGLLVTNVGGGTANNLSITTAQPKVIENAKGLLDDIEIIGTQVGNQQVTPSLTVDLGDIAPGQTADASFLLESALEGEFESFSAVFSHSSDLGGSETSLIASVTTHTLTHAGDFNYPDSTGATDYLAEDTPNAQNLPDTIYFSDGTTAAVNIAGNTTSTQVGPAGALTFQVTADVTSGWDYIQLADPGTGYTLYKVVRSDGVVIPVSDQAWTTDRTISPTGASLVDYELHILDDNSTGSYMLYYRPTTATAPTIASVSSVSSPQSSAIGSVDVTFSEPIDPSTFTTANLSLTLNGGANLINSAVTITQDSPTTFTVGGLSSITGDDGNYTLSVNNAGISDFFGDVGLAAGSASTSWATGTSVPVVVSVGQGNPTLRNTPVDSVDVVLSEPINPASFNYQALSLTLNGGSNLITSGVTVTEITPTTYSIGGLDSLTTADGSYELTVVAGGLVDGSGNAGVGFLSEAWTMSTVGPTITSLPTYIQSPRNVVVPTIDLVFSEPIVASTFTYQNITYSKPGGPNLITPGITITQLSATEFEISNFNNLIFPIDGIYTFTISAVGVEDLYGNTGTGSASDSWTLITTAPASPTDLAISPNTGVSADLTDTGSLTLTGTLPAAGLSVDVTDGLTDLGYANVTGTTFSIALKLASGENDLSVTAIDAAGNVSPSAKLNVMVDDNPLTISSVTGPASTATNSAVSTVDVTFSAPINLNTFTTANLSLTDNGGSNLITGSVTIALVSGTTSTYAISGLAGLTTAEGSYVVTVNASAIQDEAGNVGAGSMSVTWLMDTTPPTSTVTTLASQTTSTSFVVSVSGTDPAGSNDSTPSGIASFALYVSTNGGAFSQFATVTPADPSAVLVGQAGNSYGFYSVATDAAGNVQPTPGAAQQTVQILAPMTVSSITAVTPNPRNAGVSDVDVTFSAPLDLTASDDNALTLTDNGGPNLITSAVTITQVSGSTYDIGGLTGLTSSEGSYSLSVSAAFLDDQYGNPGTGGLATTWLLDTTPPTSTINYLPAATTSTSFSVSVTASDPNGANGSPASGVASIGIYVSKNGGAFTLLATVTPGNASTPFTGQAGNTYGFYSIATDNAGNVQATPTSAQATVQIVSGLTVSSITQVSPNPRNSSVSAIDVTFSEPINTGSMTTGALTLTDNNGSNLINGSVNLTLVSGSTSTYAVGGLASLTMAEGDYDFTVYAANFTDEYNNPGTGSASTTWLTDTTPPTSTITTLPSQTTSTRFVVSVTGTDPVGSDGSTPSGIASFALFVSNNGGAFSQFATATPADPSAIFVGQAGNSYGFYSIATDAAGNVQATPSGAQQTVQILAPMTVSSITAVTPNPRNAAVSDIDVTFSARST